ncbi:hypothetical protein [Qipengyuania zhejiangensis]|uniref:hypothetical protein n=1 Tax=Qipengyuania zhejiangensis TaxID=3077782 RepID=UPI002D7A0F60|nr:hypothetical protein [Qipengyuania sp. Z2]
MNWKAYLGMAMLRRLFACLALITGLAAVGTPVHANMVEVLGATLEVSQKADPSGKTEVVTCAERQRQQKLRGEKTTPCRPTEAVTVVIPTVMFGPDRAHE